MKKVLYGLVVGLLVCGAASTVLIPKIKQQSYTSGYDAGNKSGIDTGTAKGVEEGMAKMRAMQHTRHQQDSVAAVEERREAIARAKRHLKKAEKPVQNWHVIDNKIADPITDNQEAAAKATNAVPTNG